MSINISFQREQKISTNAYSYKRPHGRHEADYTDCADEKRYS